MDLSCISLAVNNNYDSLIFLGTPLLRILMKPKRKESGCQNLKSPAQTDSAVFWEGSRKETVTAEWIFKGKEILNQEWQPAAKGFISAGNRPFGQCNQTGWKFLDLSLSILILIVVFKPFSLDKQYIKMKTFYIYLITLFWVKIG